jgi:hypothetical protein
VNTRILSALNQAVTSGSPIQDLAQQAKPYTLEVYVTSVSIKVSVQNGVSITKLTESGVVYQSSNASK